MRRIGLPTIQHSLPTTLLSYSIVTCIALFVGIIIGRSSWPQTALPSNVWAVPQHVEEEVGRAATCTVTTVEHGHGYRDAQPYQVSLPDPHEGRDILSLLDLESFLQALETMQRTYFELWVGTWPEAIDWTAAVMGTLLSASLQSLNWIRSHTTSTPSQWREEESLAQSRAAQLEDTMNKYFSQSIAFYFGENAFAIRLQAYDDMLWVVLGWLESIKFIDAHAARSGMSTAAEDQPGGARSSWHGEQFIPVFAHRVRIFYDLARVGYDYTLCGGGMLWNPGLLPYKNAITNELFISASVAMYLYFPGDANDSPFTNDARRCSTAPQECRLRGSSGHEPYDAEYLANAVEAYDWLKRINMTNDQGLYVDGFHIKGYGVNDTLGTRKCDVRNEMVYTYNQGVVLSGLRGLWESTGRRSYLEDGHALVRNVINATGWNLYAEHPRNLNLTGHQPWCGLGRAGILEDACDASGTCNQDAQTFKGIFFHHLVLFCETLPKVPRKAGKTFAADRETAFLHHSSCAGYEEWVRRNAQAALNTRDDKGRFGMWWTWGLVDNDRSDLQESTIESLDDRIPEGAEEKGHDVGLHHSSFDEKHWIRPKVTSSQAWTLSDPNDRHRGRTVETQGGGLAVVRAALEFAKLKS